MGHLDDFIIDDETWTIRYVVVDTRNWWPGKKGDAFADLVRERELAGAQSSR